MHIVSLIILRIRVTILNWKTHIGEENIWTYVTFGFSSWNRQARWKSACGPNETWLVSSQERPSRYIASFIRTDGNNLYSYLCSTLLLILRPRPNFIHLLPNLVRNYLLSTSATSQWFSCKSTLNYLQGKYLISGNAPKFTECTENQWLWLFSSPWTTLITWMHRLYFMLI